MDIALPASAMPAVWPHSAVRLAYRPKPFSPDREVKNLPTGLTYAEILERTVEDPAYRPLAVVVANGERVPEHLLKARPKPGTYLTISIVPQNGQVLRTVLIVAVLIIAAVLSYGASAYATAAYGAAAGAAAAAATGAAVTVAGTLQGGLAPLLPPGEMPA